MATRPRYRVTASDGRAAFQLHVKSVIVSRTVERRDLYEYLNQADFQQRIGDAFQKAEQEIRAVAGISLESYGPMRFRTGSIIVHRSYVAHFDSAPFFHAFFYDTERNVRDIEEIIDTRLRAELSHIDNIGISTSAYATLGVIEGEVLPSPPPAAAEPPADDKPVASAPAAGEATSATPVPATSETATMADPETETPKAADAETETPSIADISERIVNWVNRAIAILLIALVLFAFLWYLTSSTNRSAALTPSGATDVPYKDIELPAAGSRKSEPAAPRATSCDIAKQSPDAAIRDPGGEECAAR